MKTEKIVLGIFVVGFALKMLNIPGGNLISVLSMTVLSLFYFPAGFYFLCDKKIDQKTVGFSVVSGFVLAIVVLGILFKVMHWPGGMVMLVSGLILVLPVAFVSYRNYTGHANAENQAYYKNIFVRTMVATILALFSFIY